ncbi:MAG TPA: hypothetical protein VMT34_15720, partial [Aggregatilineales bacterium]|nr:hypothetical protein [Aggregatilineales bacterium]
MSRFIAILLIVLTIAGVTGLPAHAQSNNASVITLDDSNPSVDAMLLTNNGAPGVIYVELDHVKLNVKDDQGVEVLSLGDNRVTGVAIQLAQGAHPHTLHAERLPNVPTARLSITTQATMPSALDVNALATSSTTLVSHSIMLVTPVPSQTLPFTVSAESDMLSVQFAQHNIAGQLVDDKGTALASSLGGDQITGFAFRLAPGNYSFNLANQDLNNASDVLVALSQGPASTLPPVSNVAAALAGCTASLNSGSA